MADQSWQRAEALVRDLREAPREHLLAALFNIAYELNVLREERPCATLSDIDLTNADLEE